MRRFTPLILLAAFVTFLPAASAHAWLLDGKPGPDEHVETSPSELHLRFTEDVEHEFTGAEVMDVNGTHYESPPPMFGPARNEFRLGVRPLPDGVYTVKWATLSVDTHTARGSYLFAVGNASLNETSTSTHEHGHGGDGLDPRLEGGLRTLYFAGLALAIGVPVFLALVAPPKGPDTGITLRAGAAASLVGALAGIGVLAAFAQRIDQPTWKVAMDVDTGRLLLLRAVHLAIAGLLLGFASHGPQPRRWAWLTSLGFALLAARAVASSSHAAALSSQGDLAVAADFLHLLAVGAWFGGLVALLLHARNLDASTLGAAVRRFSPLAVTSVFLLVATGVYASTRHLDRIEQLWTTEYGGFLLAKIGLSMLLIALGAINQFRVGPGLVGGSKRPQTLRRTVGIEVALATLVLVFAGQLTTTAPPMEMDTTQGEILPIVFTTFTEHAHIIVHVSPKPVTVGIQRVLVEVHDNRGGPNPEGTEVYVKIARAGNPEPEAVRPLGHTSTYEWSVRGGLFTERGDWTLYVIVQRPDEYNKFPIPIVVA